MSAEQALGSGATSAAPSTVDKVFEAVAEAIPDMDPDNVVALLEFIYIQHSGSNFNPDNTHKAQDIIGFVENHPFVISESGVRSLASLARYALAKSEGQGNTAEHQLWLLASGALNTAAAVAEFQGDAARFFDAVDRGGLERGKYMQRHYATLAMKSLMASSTPPQQIGSGRLVGATLRHWLAPENFVTAAIRVTSFSIVIGYLLSLWIAPIGP